MDLSQKLKELPDIFTHASELMNEMLADEMMDDDQSDIDDFFHNYDLRVKRDNSEIEQPPTSNIQNDYNLNKRRRLSASPNSMSTHNYSTRTSVSSNSLVRSATSTPASVRSYCSSVEGFSPARKDSPLQTSSPFSVETQSKQTPSPKKERSFQGTYNDSKSTSPPQHSSQYIFNSPSVTSTPQYSPHYPYSTPHTNSSSHRSLQYPFSKQSAVSSPHRSPPQQLDTPRSIPPPQRSPIIKKEEIEEETPIYISDRPQPPSLSESITVNKHEYTILCEIGQGTTAKIFQVLSHTYGEIFALKWIEINDEEDRQTIQNEIDLLKSLKDQDSIVRLLDFEISPSVVFMIMECGETDLATLMSDESLNDVSCIAHYWKQMLQAVYVIHHHKIVHSDLNPANFVMVKGRLKLIDFEVASKFSDDTTSVQRAGQVKVVNYMAPETISGDDTPMKYGRPSDVWSLGCMLYELVYGATPFDDLPLTKKITCIQNPNHEIPFPSTILRGGRVFTIPPRLIDLLKSCLQRNPRLRPSIYDLLRNPLINMC